MAISPQLLHSLSFAMLMGGVTSVASEHMDHDKVDLQFFSWSTIIGALIGLGQILDSSEKLSWRVIFGRALVSAGLASMAPMLLVWLPDMTRTAEFAFAAVFASLGTSGMQMIIRKVLTGKFK